MTARPQRDRALLIRLTEEEHQALMNKKTRPELARWARERLLAHEEAPVRTIRHNYPPEITRALASIGNNLNQIARGVNSANRAGRQIETIQILAQLAAIEKILNHIKTITYDR